MDRPALERLGHDIVSRRLALGYRNRTDLANSLQFTVRTLADIEHGVTQGQPRHLRHAGKQAFLGTRQHRHHPRGRRTQRAGGQATPGAPDRLSHAATDALSRASTDELLLELRRRIITPREAREVWEDWGGLHPRGGDWPEEG